MGSIFRWNPECWQQHFTSVGDSAHGYASAGQIPQACDCAIGLWPTAATTRWIALVGLRSPRRLSSAFIAPELKTSNRIVTLPAPSRSLLSVAAGYARQWLPRQLILRCLRARRCGVKAWSCRLAEVLRRRRGCRFHRSDQSNQANRSRDCASWARSPLVRAKNKAAASACVAMARWSTQEGRKKTAERAIENAK